MLIKKKVYAGVSEILAGLKLEFKQICEFDTHSLYPHQTGFENCKEKSFPADPWTEFETNRLTKMRRKIWYGMTQVEMRN